MNEQEKQKLCNQLWRLLPDAAKPRVSDVGAETYYSGEFYDDLPMFTDDPRAYMAVLGECVRRGWWWRMATGPEADGLFGVIIRQHTNDGPAIGVVAADTPGLAICLAAKEAFEKENKYGQA